VPVEEGCRTTNKKKNVVGEGMTWCVMVVVDEEEKNKNETKRKKKCI